MEEKRFQLITWNIQDEKIVSVTSEIYDNVKEIISAEKGKKYVIAIGLNPSNKTVFNEDETNLYLRDKIYRKFKCDGYILTNLSYKIESDSKNISIKNIDKNHIDKIIDLIEKSKDKNIVIFFGQKGKELLNSSSGGKANLDKLKQCLSSNKKRVYYTESIAKFIHPGHSDSKYELVNLKANTL